MTKIPECKVTLDGKDITGRIKPRLCGFTLTEKRGGDADQLDLTIDDADGQVAIPRKGVIITVAMGWRGEALVGKGSFKVDQVRHSGTPDVLTITARSADFSDQLKTRREGSWRATTLGAVLEEIAGRNGLTPAIGEGLASIEVEVLQQSRESDAALLTRLGKQHDAISTVKSGKLVFVRKGQGKTASGKPIPAFTITRKDGDQHSWETADRDAAPQAVQATWHDRGAAERKRVKVGSGKTRRLKKTYASEAEAKQAAQAELGRIKRGGAKFGLNLAEGRPDLYPERKGSVSGWKPEIDGSAWLIDEAVHSYGDNGMTTDLKLELA